MTNYYINVYTNHVWKIVHKIGINSYGFYVYEHSKERKHGWSLQWIGSNPDTLYKELTPITKEEAFVKIL